MWLHHDTLLSPEQRAALERVLAFSSLQEVVRWAFAQTPPRDVREIIVQDEYSHDVVVPWGDVYLVFDTT